MGREPAGGFLEIEIVWHILLGWGWFGGLSNSSGVVGALPIHRTPPQWKQTLRGLICSDFFRQEIPLKCGLDAHLNAMSVVIANIDRKSVV